MASTSASRSGGAAGRIKSAATTLFSDNQSLLAEIRKVVTMMKDVGVDLERENESQMVKELEDGVLQLLAASEDCTHLSTAIQSVGNGYQPREERVHHAGQPMPGEEQEDLVMTSTQSNILNVNCPLTGKPITELENPVRSLDCKHIYEQNAIMQYIRSKHAHSQCPVAGCPKILVAERVVCDPLLLVEIEEMSLLNKQSARPDVVEDFTATDDEESG
ncbi:E3 SUMO-protein ligase MMS21 isoform X2 [Rhododendron vialii]|uniref:E3 SUMO-protein ligase MMS21 isoform X2 n=1 Tax=Rhododendron vialii TaxID=182163 RepID=UPI0026605B31|nr:E3 SUMO-protein ligase MMS21 isoform X2 [Rhododendron vialii]